MDLGLAVVGDGLGLGVLSLSASDWVIEEVELLEALCWALDCVGLAVVAEGTGVDDGVAVVGAGEVVGDAVVAGAVVAGEVVAGEVVAGAVVAGAVVAGAVVAGAVVAGAVVAGAVVAGAVVAGAVVAGAVVAGAVVVCVADWEAVLPLLPNWYLPLVQAPSVRDTVSVSTSPEVDVSEIVRAVRSTWAWLLPFSR